MSRRVRDRGPRRRCASDRTLVRTRPAVNVPPPPIPLNGPMRRMMVPSLISDYEGLATASWSTGVTGNFGALANSSWNCFFHHVVRTDPRSTYSVILPPVRWTIAAPASDGGNYDFWIDRSPAKVGYYPQGYGTIGAHEVGVTNTLLPSTHYAEYQQGFCELADFPFPPVCQPTPANGNVWRESSLQAISPGTQVWQGGWSIAAIRHRVNGSAVGSLRLNPPGNRSVTNDWRFDTSKGDTYAIDVWYRFTVPAANFFATVKSCGYIPTTRVSNGSRRVLPTIPFEPVALFRNVNYRPAFNPSLQTFSVTVSGHSGWTLKDGSNGPHKIIDGGGWLGGIGGTLISFRPAVSNGFCNAILFWYARELVQVEFYPGPLHSAWTGAISTTPPLIYRPAASGYRNQVNSVDFGTLGLIPAGPYNQAGTTTFNLVQEISDAVPSPPFIGTEPVMPSAFEFGAGVGILNEDVPTSITMTRVNR